jgi:hypothetical protein
MTTGMRQNSEFSTWAAMYKNTAGPTVRLLTDDELVARADAIFPDVLAALTLRRSGSVISTANRRFTVEEPGKQASHRVGEPPGTGRAGDGQRPGTARELAVEDEKRQTAGRPVTVGRRPGIFCSAG